MARKINVGLIGAGWPTWQHLEAYKKLHDVKVLALCDINPRMLKKIADQYSIPKRFTEYEDMLKLKELDAVSICTPNYLHVSQVIKALESDKHVICEKPLSINAREACKIVQPLKKSKKVFMIAYVYRFRNGAKYLKKIIDKNELGKIYYAKAQILRQRGIPGMGGWFTTKKFSGGGSLIDCGVHMTDLVWWLMGCPKPVSAFASTYAEFGSRGLGGSKWGVSVIKKPRPFDVEDLAVGLIKFDNNATLFLEAGWAACVENRSMYCSILGTKSGVEVFPPSVVKYTKKDPYRVIKPRIPDNNAFDDEIKHFIDCIKNKRKPIAGVEQGIAIMKMFDAVYESARIGKAVRIK